MNQPAGVNFPTAATQRHKIQFALVVAMNLAFGNAEGSLNDYKSMPDMGTAHEIHYDVASWTRLENQCKSINDEVDEFQHALGGANWEDSRDAVCDVKVFAFGGAHFMGYYFPDAPAYPYDTYEKERAEFYRVLEPVTALRAAYSHLMHAIMERDLYRVQRGLHEIVYVAEQSAGKVGINPTVHDLDMRSVLAGCMTRFIKDEDDKEATIAKHAAKGITDVYFEGEYPTMIMKSASAQPDAPIGKFLKSASFKEPLFVEAAYDVDAAGLVVASATLS